MNGVEKDSFDETALALWEKHEKIAMHFNDLILKVRIQALGALAAIITVGGALLHDKPADAAVPWALVSVFFAVLIAFWVAIWILDFAYYNRLLRGAVDAILGLEDCMREGRKITIDMSHRIESAVRGDSPKDLQEQAFWGPRAFYSIVLAVLVVGLLISSHRWLCASCYS